MNLVSSRTWFKKAASLFTPDHLSRHGRAEVRAETPGGDEIDRLTGEVLEEEDERDEVLIRRRFEFHEDIDITRRFLLAAGMGAEYAKPLYREPFLDLGSMRLQKFERVHGARRPHAFLVLLEIRAERFKRYGQERIA